MENFENLNKRKASFEENENTSKKHAKLEEIIDSISDLERDLENVLSEVKESLLGAMDSIENSQGAEDLKRDAKNVIEKINQDFQNILSYKKDTINTTNVIQDEEE